MNPQQTITEFTVTAMQEIYGRTLAPEAIMVQETATHFEGQFTLVCYAFAQMKMGAPEEIAEKIGAYLVEQMEGVESYEVVKGFLNLSFSQTYWLHFFHVLDPMEYGFNDQLTASEKLEEETESVLQDAYFRALSIARKAEELEVEGNAAEYTTPEAKELELIIQMATFSGGFGQTGETVSPSVLVKQLHELAKSFNSFFSSVTILQAGRPHAVAFRLALCSKLAMLFGQAFQVLGIETSEQQ